MLLRVSQERLAFDDEGECAAMAPDALDHDLAALSLRSEKHGKRIRDLES